MSGRPRGLIAVAAPVLLLLLASHAPAWQQAKPGKVLEYRNVYVPTDRLAEMASGYLPVKRTEFEDLLQTINAAPQGPGGAGARLTSASYSARLEQYELVAGLGSLKVQHRLASAALLGLEPCTLAVSKPVWVVGETSSAARLGSDGAGRLAVVVEPAAADNLGPGDIPLREEDLQFQWTLRGARDPSGSLLFDLQLPAAPTTSLALDLPQGVTPIVPRGLVTRLAQTAEHQQAERQHWLIELGGRSRTTLSIVADKSLEQSRRYVLLRQLTTYDISPQSLDVTLELELDVHQEPLRQLVVLADPQLQVTSIKLGDKDIAWQFAAAEGDGPRRIAVEFAEPLQGTNRVLRIAGMARVVSGERWRLPAAQVENVFWQEGAITMNVPASLEVRDLKASGCRQTKAALLPAPRLGESLQFQAHVPDAALEVIIGQPTLQLASHSGLSLKWDGPSIAARLVADITATRGQTHLLEADVGPGWLVDAVETVPPEALDDWTVTPSGPSAALSVRLSQSVSSGRGVRLIVLGHRRAPAEREPLLGRQCRLITLRHVYDERRLVSVQAEGQQQLTLAGDAEVQRLDPRVLAEADRLLLDISGVRLVYLDKSLGPAFGMRVSKEKPRYSAQARLTVTLGGSTLTESYRLRVFPEATALTRVLVHFARSSGGAFQWRLEPAAAGDFSARPLADDPQRGEGETWEILLQRPSSFPFELFAERVLEQPPGQPPRQVALVSLPEADAQSGTIEVHAAESAAPWIEAVGLKSVTPPTTVSHTVNTCRAAFRYTPAQDQALLVGQANERDAAAACFAWQSLLTCRASPGGQCVYTVRYNLENVSRPSIAVRLPVDARLREVRVGGARALVAASQRDRHEVQVPLPVGQRYITAEVEYDLPFSAISLVGSRTLGAPRIDVPVLHSEMRLYLPPGLQLANPEQPSDWGWASGASWRERLFGPLARPEGQRPPSLFSWTDWTRQIRLEQTPASLIDKGQLCLQAWQEALAALRASSSSATWGDWISAYDQLASEHASILPAVRVNASRLEQAGIYGDTPLAAEVQRSPDQAETLLRSVGLVLILQGGQVVLTTRDQLEFAPQSWHVLGSHAILAPRDPHHVTADENSLLLRPAAWLAQPGTARFPWPQPSASRLDDLEAVGWHTYRFAVGGEQVSVVLYRDRDIQAIAWGLWLATIALVSWQCAQRWRLWLMLLAASGLAALFLPLPLAPWGTAMFWGTLLGLCVSVVLRPQVREPSTPAETELLSRVAPPAPVATLVLLAIVLATLSTSLGDEAAPARDEPSVMQEAQRVLIPVDETQTPVGEYVYLPRPFYETLSRQARTAKALPQGWLVYEATYRGRLQWEDVGDSLALPEISISYDLEVFQPNTRVTIGLGRENVHLLDDHVSLEGDDVPIEWLESGAGFVVPIAQPGRYRLELSFRPVSRMLGAREEIDVRIPQLARSQLVLKLPADAPTVQVPRALGAVEAQEPGELRVGLGPAQRLTIHWLDDGRTELPASEVDATQLLWWKIRPGATVLEATWHLKSSQQPLQEVRLIADPRLRLLPLDADQPVAEQFVREGDVRVIHFVLKEPAQREVTVRASFSLAGATGIGSLVLPQLEVVADRITNRWLGVTAASTLTAEPAAGMEVDPLAPQEFLAAWGEAENPPLQAYRLDGRNSLFTLAVQPREPQVVVEQAVNLTVRSESIDAVLAANVQVIDGQLFQHRLEISPEFQPRQVMVVNGEVSRVARFARPDPNTLNVFLPSAGTGTYRVVVNGRMVTPAKGKWNLPLLRLVEAGARTASITVDRTSYVGVELPDLAGYQVIEGLAATGDLLPQGQRRVAVLKPADETQLPALAVSVEPNRVQFQAEQVVAMVRTHEGWQAVVDVFCKISAGSLETLRWEIPGEWNGPFRANMPGTLEIVTVPGQTRRHLVARFLEPQRSDFHIQMTAPLGVAMGERLQLPEIGLLDADPAETFVVLPTRAEQQQIAWETRGLQAVDLSPRYQQLVPAGTQSYAVVGPRYQAAIRRLERLAGVPQVRLAEALAERHPDGSWHGVASFDLEPAGLSRCTLELPRGYELIQASVGQIPAVLQRESEARWQVLLHHDQLPQQVEVVFQAAGDAVTASASHVELRMPTLADLPVERTLWLVESCPLDRHRVALVDAELQTNSPRQAMFRLKNSVALLEQAASLLGESDPGETVAWFTPWARRNVSAQAALARFENNRDSPSLSSTNEIEAMAAEVQAMAQQLGATQATTQVQSESALPHSAADVLRARLDAQLSGARATVSGSTPSLTLRIARQTSFAELERWLAAYGLLCLIAALSLLARDSTLAETFARWPQVWGIAIGLAWWHLLAPGMLGLLIALVFVVASVRSPWPRGRELGSMLRARRPAPRVAGSS